MAWTSAHTVLGEFENGMKVVHTDIIPDDASGTAVAIAPLKTVYSYFPGVKDCGTTPRTFSFAQSTTQLNKITVTPSGDATGALLGIISIGV